MSDLIKWGLAYLVLKGLSSDKKEQVEKKPATKSSPYIPRRYKYDSYEKYGSCEIHGEDSKQCLYSSHKGDNRCIECNEGMGDSISQWCKICNDEFHYDLSNDD